MDPKYSLGEKDGQPEPARAVYETLRRGRRAVEDTAREMAELTIPSVFPPETYKPGDRLPGNNQSVGAWCVNSLASHLMFMAFPPGRPMLRFEVVEHRMRDEISGDPDLWSRIVLALSRKEIEHRRRAETTPLRSAYVGALKQLLVAGNVLWDQMAVDHPTYHRVDRYVCRRDGRGQQLMAILHETVAWASLEEDVQALVLRNNASLGGKAEWEREVDIYTVCKLHTEADTGEKVWCYWQEYEGEAIPGTELTADLDNPPLYAAWLIPVYGEDWGRSYCEEYRGDLYTVETHAYAINDGSALASLALLFVEPGARTSLRAIKEAENLSVLSGNAQDITSFRLDKGHDFSFVRENFESAIRRLARAFLTHSSIQRDAERVTAEEWRRMAAELDRAMGGVYSELAQSTQRHVVLRYVRLHEEDDPSIPALPEHIIRIAVVTGIDAMGATTEEEALVGFVGTMGQLFGPEVVAGTINPLDFARRLAAEKGLQIEGLVKSEEQIAEERQAAQEQEAQRLALEKGIGPGVKALGDMAQQQIPQQE